MRLIYTGSDQRKALSLSEFLKREGVENECDIQTNRDWGSDSYGDVRCLIWIVDEEQVELAKRWIDEFEQHPENPVFHAQSRPFQPFFERAAPPPPNRSDEKRTPGQDASSASNGDPKNGKATLALLLLCAAIFLLGELTAPQLPSSIPASLPATPLFMPPIDKALLYDYPQAYEIVDTLVRAYGVDKLQNEEALPQTAKQLLEKFRQTPYWQGIYDQLVLHVTHRSAPWDFTAPLFEKIRQGEVWRLVTPILLHANIFHIFFNMIWLLLLGKLIEERVGIPRYLLMILLIAAFSNSAQYLMSGPDFLGISGVICGMLGFIWSRQHVAAWEGYNLMPGVLGFMLTFILGIAAIQVVGFFQEAFWHNSSLPAIASTAHLTGGLLGVLLGRFEFFRMHEPLR